MIVNVGIVRCDNSADFLKVVGVFVNINHAWVKTLSEVYERNIQHRDYDCIAYLYQPWRDSRGLTREQFENARNTYTALYEQLKQPGFVYSLKFRDEWADAELAYLEHFECSGYYGIVEQKELVPDEAMTHDGGSDTVVEGMEHLTL